MDNSQSSDFLSESTDIFCNSPINQAFMNTAAYESLVLSTKSAFSSVRKQIKNSSFFVYFSSLLEDCSTCISQGLDFISDIIAETNISQDKLKEYINDAVCLLQLLSDLIKHVIESMSVACCSLKTFPTVTGRIIMLIFTHCKDSESLYGSHISYVEKHLKDLFRTCHELQLTYLMVLEKHFIFDLTENEEQDILTEALDINLKIGEIVQGLDVKTMAEQWKAYTVICEKYSNSLVDKRIYRDCTKILCSMITNNIKTALEENQEEKIVLRSLKVSSFTLKILLRVCIMFRHAVLKDHESLVELLLYIHLNNEAYLHTICGKSSQLINLVITNVTSPANLLLNELINDEKLLISICNYNKNEIKKDDSLLGLILLILAIINISIQKNGEQSIKVPKHMIINAIYNLLPHCHVWFNMGLQLKSDTTSIRQYQTHGLFEHILAHVLALAATMDNIDVLEKKMLEALLGIDLYSALFSANLWVLMARMSSRQLLLTQVLSLSKIYKKLEKHLVFADSPQKVHLTNIISRLFELMNSEDKMKVYTMFPIHDIENIGLLTCLKLSSSPNEVQINSEEIVLEMFKNQMQNIMHAENVDISDLINIINLTSTCLIINREDEMDSLLILAWSKACPKNIQHITKGLNKDSLWYYKYLEALVSLTNSMEHIFHGDSANLVKVLHIISHVVQSGYRELKLLLINILCKLGNVEPYDMNKHIVVSILMQTFSKLFQDTDLTVKNKLFTTLRNYRTNSLDRIVTKLVNEDDSLRETWDYFVKHGILRKGQIKLKEHLHFAKDFQYSHKCMDNVGDIGAMKVQKSLSNHFDFVDIDSLLDAESDSGPACKKAKLNTSLELEQIITRLETDASSLCKIKENIFNTEYLNRIKNVCNKLNNILD